MMVNRPLADKRISQSIQYHVLTVTRYTLLIALTTSLGLSSISKQATAQAAPENPVTIGGTWSSLVIDLPMGEKWMVRNEFRFRTAQFFNDRQQFLVRPSVHYKVSNGFSFSTGITLSDNAPYEESGFSRYGFETNLYEDLVLRHGEGRWSFNHRYRFEQRWISSQADGSKLYRNRFRYRFGMSYDITELTHGKLQATFYNELMLNLYNDFTANGYDRDWTGIGLIYPLHPKLKLTAGFQQNWVRRSTDTYERQRLLLLSLGWKIERRKD